MRSLLAILAFSSINAFACPDLTGTFTCTFSDGSSDVLTVSQENKDGVTLYIFGGEVTPADNAIYTIPDDATLKQGTFRAWCDDSVTLKAQILGQYYDAGQYYGDLTLNINYTIENGNLKDYTNGTLVNSNGTYPINSETVCTRNP